MAISDSDLQTIATWCDSQVPTHLRDHVRIEYAATNQHVDILESHPMDPHDATDWVSVVVARLRYTTKTGLWSIYWADRNSQCHHYPDFRPTPHVDFALDFLENTDDPIFWG